jgi:hypothetical protein
MKASINNTLCESVKALLIKEGHLDADLSNKPIATLAIRIIVGNSNFDFLHHRVFEAENKNATSTKSVNRKPSRDNDSTDADDDLADSTNLSATPAPRRRGRPRKAPVL